VPASTEHLGEYGGAVGAVRADEEDVDPVLLGDGDAGLVEREDQPLEPGAEPHTGGGPAAELLGEAVVAAAAAERAGRSAFRPDELPSRAGVVVQPADE
jgi:hypothetical protein